MPGLLQQLLRPFRRSIVAREGEYRDGPWIVMNPDGVLPHAWGQYWNYWQMGYDPVAGARGAVVEACVAAYAQTISQCPGDHWLALPDGGRERVTTSALSRILRSPNEYQSRSDFIMNLVRDLYLTGNTYHLAERNNRFEVDALHPFNPGQSQPVISAEGGVYYRLGGNNILESQGRAREYGVAPARDVLHIKLEAKPGEPLVGIPPLRHAELAITAQAAIGSQLINFFANMSRPPGVIETDLNLTKAQVTELRERLNEAWRGVDNLGGGPPILTNGLKFHGIAISAKEAELANALKMTQDEIFMVYGVPPAILGLTDRSTFASTEALMQFWLARGLGFAINHIETAFDHFFGLRGWPYEYVEFDTHALLRVAYRDRIEGLARGVISGIYSPNEARNMEDLPDAEAGGEPRVQQQVVPLSAWNQAQPSTPAPDAPPAAPPAAETTESEEDKALDFAEFYRGMEERDVRCAAQ
ncbi:phage portal protein [Sinorhizobium fredii]|uniref:phage portal protein n=1 Tax=Rhizobium fredii TaxID=380 RepID=UPI0004B11DBF|nr:phage portal protein [Sinorhizobium fredii]